MAGMKISIDGIEHWFAGAIPGERMQALQRTDLVIEPGEFVAIVGPSGCGKTTLLNMVAALIEPSAGTVHVDNQKPSVGHPDVGYVFARDCLLPWRTALGNVTLPLEIRGIAKNLRTERARRCLKEVGLENFEQSYPSQLSQGMRQRAALARMLAPEPSTLLMDEPFSAVDAQTRLILHELFLRLWDHHHSTVLFITHDLSEAILLADRVIVFSRRPGHVKGDFRVDLNRPRNVAGLQGREEYHSLYAQIWKVLEEEMAEKQYANSGGLS